MDDENDYNNVIGISDKKLDLPEIKSEYYREMILASLIKAAMHVRNSPDFSNSSIVTEWIYSLQQHDRRKIESCFKIFKQKISSKEIKYYPNIQEFLSLDDPIFDKQVKNDILKLCKSFTISSHTTFKDYKDKFNISDICFFYVKEKFQTFDQLQLYFYNEKFRDKNIADATKILTKYYEDYDRSELFRQEVLLAQPVIYIRPDQEPEEILDDKERFSLWNSLKHDHMPYLEDRIEKNKLTKEPEQIKIQCEPYRNCDKIVAECKKLHQSNPGYKYSYDLDGVIYTDDGKGIWRYLKTTLF